MQKVNFKITDEDEEEEYNVMYILESGDFLCYDNDMVLFITSPVNYILIQKEKIDMFGDKSG